MTKALILSFLFHSLAFAGSFFLLGNRFSTDDASELKGNLISVDMTFSSIEKENAAVMQSFSVSNETNKKTFVSVKTSQPSSSLYSAQSGRNVSMLSDEGNAKGEEGAANLIPHPSNQPPVYPERAREQGLMGKIMLQLTVDQMGRVIHVKVIEGTEISSILRDAAILAVKEWRFKFKTTPRDKAVLSLPIVFNLED